MKILLATDRSDYSKAAVNSVAERPWPEGSEVKIISAMEIPYAPTTETWVLPNSYYSDSHAVATHAHCSVEIVRQKTHAEK